MNALLTRLWAFVPAAGAAIVFLVVTSMRGVPDAARIICLSCLVMSALCAVFVGRAEVRSHSAAALAIGAVVAIGQAKAGLPFAIPAAFFAVLVVLAMRKARDAEARTHGRGAGVLLAVAGTVFAGLVFSLPGAGGIIERQINKWISAPITNSDSVGFASRMRLGSTRNMLKSNRVVLRIVGPSEEVEYLRGAVYDDYEQRVWSTTRYQTESVEAIGVTPAITIRYSPDAPITQGDDARWFLPPNACNLHTRSGHIAVNPFHVYQPDPRSDLQEISFDTKSCPPLPTDKPRGYDLGVPANIFAKLGPIARDWTAGATTDAEKVEAISKHLSAYGYSLDVERDERIDPVVDFLTVHKEGHCELFASALVLLARLSHVPARVVSGYHVSERSTVFEHAVVRERNAHAWAEVFVGGSWQGVDPTPPIENMQGSRWERFREAVSFEWERLTTELTLTHFIVAAIIAGAIFLLRRWWVARRTKNARRRDAASLPLPCFVTLEGSLARAGHVREPSEPVESFAARIESLDVPWAAAVAEATRRYASHRYGGKSSEREVETAVIAAARAVSAAPL